MEHYSLLQKHAEDVLKSTSSGDVSYWQRLVEFAEEQRMAPLFLAHARQAGVELPEEARLQLHGLSLRHTLASQARMQVLDEVLRASQAAGIEVVLLKGVAMAHLAYPRPGLRPMRDIDLLTRPGRAGDLQRLLVEMGFRPSPPQPGKPVSARHLNELSRPAGSFQVTVEVHDRLFDPTWRVRTPRIDTLIERARPFDLNGLAACSLGLEEMLWHTYQHMINEEIRLIGVADLISLSEKFVDEIDWERIQRCYPGILRALALFHPYSPLDKRLIQQARIPTLGRPVTIGADLKGWPRIPVSKLRELGTGRFLRETIWPSEWWLYLYYAIKNRRLVALYRWLVHPFELVRLAAHHILLRFKH
jgi:hypothetical protein